VKGHVHRISLWLAGAIAGAFLIANQASCGSTTAGKEIAFSASFAGGTAGNSAPSAAFTTYAGWSVTLSKALVAVGPLYLYEGAPQANLFKKLLSIPSAYACPTHSQYNKGTVLGEILHQNVVDLLGEVTNLGTVVGIAGTCRTVELHLHPPGEIALGASQTDIGLLEGSSIRLEGIATKGGTTLPFIARLTIPDEGLMRVVESIAADVVLDDASVRSGSLLVEPLLDVWLASVEFDSLSQKEGERYVVSDDTQAWAALVRGIRSRQSYRVSWRTP
jgi:hypothetical protein